MASVHRAMATKIPGKTLKLMGMLWVQVRGGLAELMSMLWVECTGGVI